MAGLAIWKYELGAIPNTHLEMPAGAELLHVAVQNSTPCLWALVDPVADREDRWFLQVGTGHSFTPPGRYVGTYQLDLPGGVFVGHVFQDERTDAQAA